MKKRISIILVIALCISILSTLASCTPDSEKTKPIAPPTINGTELKDFVIVYDEQGLDYNKRAAEFIKNTTRERYNIELEIIDDDTEKRTHEIVVGETSRAISESLNAETVGFEFAIMASEGHVALEGDYFVIAAAAYFFMETYASGDGQRVSIPESASVHKPITKEAKNFILLIGDGMGVNQTLIFDYLENDVPYGDGEDFFYGYLFPYMGMSRTDSLTGTTDSAAGGTALACGVKTYNEYIGLDKDMNPVKSLTELASERGMAAAVMSTEIENGATPASFSAHASSRHSQGEILRSILATQEKYGTIVECGFDYYKADYMPTIEGKIEETLNSVSANEKGFFLMYEEAHIDKNCHSNSLEGVLKTVVRFNQAIARFMEFAFYNPDTLVLITADHETGALLPDGNGSLAFNSEDHSSADVQIFAYGHGAELFSNVNIENIQIAHTIAALMGEDNFGDQSVYQSLTKGNK